MADISPLVIRLLRQQAQAHGDGWKINPRGTYGVTREPDCSWVLRSVTAQPLKTFEQPLHLNNPANVLTKPRSYITCNGSGFLYSFIQTLCGHRTLPPKEA